MQHYQSVIKVVIADDHELLRQGFKTIMKKVSDIKVIGEASHGKELLEEVEKSRPDIVLTDIKMPIMDGIEATKTLKKKLPNIKVIALSMFDDDNLIIDMLESGAKGYLLKNASKSELEEAVRTVYSGDIYYCKKTSNKLIQLMAQSKFNPYSIKEKPDFTKNELEVISLICKEASNKEIANILHLSIRTIEGYREKIQEKTKTKNTAGIVVYAIKNGLFKI